MNKNFLIVFLFFCLTLILFRKIFTGLLPLPSNELVVGYFPWNGGGWQGYQEVTPFKAIVATDVFRQQFPWLKFSLEMVREKFWPLWNPYNFSGIPHLANSQVHFFYPLNIIFFFLPQVWAWVIFVTLAPFLSMIFMFLYARKINFSWKTSLFVSLAFAFSSIMIFWLEWGFIAHGLMYLPLFLWLIEKILEKVKIWHYFFLIFLIYSEITVGYFPLTIYVFIFSLIYFLYRLLTVEKKPIFKKKVFFFSFLSLILAFLLSAVQLLPLLEAYGFSARQIEGSKEIFTRSLLSPKHLVTVFAHDFFGNFMTRNFWDRDYTEIVGWFGVVALIFAFLGIFLSEKKLKKFYLLSVFISLFFALKNPFAFLPLDLKIPILSTGLPSRSLFIFEFSMILLAGMGLDKILKLSNYQVVNSKKILKILIIPGIVYLGLWLFVLFGKNFLTDPEWSSRFVISRRNLFLPTFIFLGTSFSLIFFLKLKKFKNLFFILIFFLSLMEYFYFSNKFLPFGSRKNIFPSHPLLSFLKENQGLFRHYGVAEAKLDNNFATYFNFYSTEGFDSLYPQRYGELLSATLNGQKPKEILRSDAFFPQKDTKYRQKVFDLLGVKYLLNRLDREKPKQEIDFSQNNFPIVWQEDNLEVFENKSALPRFFLVGDYKLAKSDQEILDIFFADNFDPQEAVVLEENLADFKLDSAKDSKIKLLSYKPGKIILQVEAKNNNLLFFSENFYPGWQALIDGKEEKIYRANYTFQAVKIPKGSHSILLFYLPDSFKQGKNISFFSFISIILLGVFLILKKRLF